MSHDSEKLLSLASMFESYAAKSSKKLDPKAKVRNRGTVCVPAEQAKDKKDHFPINDADQARNALARVQQYSSVPSWYKGSLKGLQALVSRKVHAKYPSIGKDKSSKKSSSGDLSDLLKFAEPTYDPSMKEALLSQLEDVRSEIRALNTEKEDTFDQLSRRLIIRKIEQLKSKKLEIELELEKLSSQEAEAIEFSQARPMNPMDSPWGEFASGAADDDEIKN